MSVVPRTSTVLSQSPQKYSTRMQEQLLSTLPAYNPQFSRQSGREDSKTMHTHSSFKTAALRFEATLYTNNPCRDSNSDRSLRYVPQDHGVRPDNGMVSYFHSPIFAPAPISTCPPRTGSSGLLPPVPIVTC